MLSLDMKRGLPAAILLFFACAQKPYGPAPEVGIPVFLTGGPPGGIASLGELRGQVVVLEFWATWCKPCIQTIPHMNKLVDRYQDKPVRFISVTSEKEAEVRPFLLEHPIKSWVALDPEHRLAYAFRVRGIPRVAVIDPYGQIVHLTDPRFMTPSDIEDGLRAKPPPPPAAKT